MSESVSTLAPLDGESADDEPVPNAPEASSPGEKPSCSCSRCGLYKWYPPLLLLSTVMAGAFCWMYITKPVILSQPGETQPVGTQPAFQEGGAPGSPGGDVPPTAGGAGELDPALPSLPGDSGGEIASDARTSIILGQEGNDLRPLVVKRPKSQLFKPFVINEPPSGTREGSADSSLEPTGEESVEGGSETAAEADERVASEEGGQEGIQARSDDQPYQIPASFMAEFISAPN